MKKDFILSNYMFKRLKISLVKLGIYNKKERKEIIKKSKKINDELIASVVGVNSKNPMAANIYFSFPIIALYLAVNKSLDITTMETIVKFALDSFLVKLFYSTTNFNKEKDSEKFLNEMKKYSLWHETHENDENSWSFDFSNSHKFSGCYYELHSCPIADTCKKLGLEDFNHILCNIDYITFGLSHGTLIRENTIAKGNNYCDFHVVGDKSKESMSLNSKK